MATSSEISQIQTRLDQLVSKSKEIRLVIVQDGGSFSSVLDAAATVVGLGLDKYQRNKEAINLLNTVDNNINVLKTVGLPKVLGGTYAPTRMLADIDQIKKTLDSIAPDMAGWSWGNATVTVVSQTADTVKEAAKTSAMYLGPIILGLVVLVVLVKVV